MGGDRKGIDVESSHTAGRRHLVRSAWGYPCQVGGARLGESTLGYPVSDQADTSDGKARLSRFQKGRLEWDKATRRIDVDINIEDGLDLAHQKEERHHLQRIQVEKFADTPSVVDELTSRAFLRDSLPAAHAAWNGATLFSNGFEFLDEVWSGHSRHAADNSPARGAKTVRQISSSVSGWVADGSAGC